MAGNTIDHVRAGRLRLVPQRPASPRLGPQESRQGRVSSLSDYRMRQARARSDEERRVRGDTLDVLTALSKRVFDGRIRTLVAGFVDHDGRFQCIALGDAVIDQQDALAVAARLQHRFAGLMDYEE